MPISDGRFQGVDDLHLLADLADASGEAVQAVDGLGRPGNRPPPPAKGTFRLGTEKFEQKLRLEEGVALPVDAPRRLAIAQEEFRSIAGRLNGGDPMAAWHKARQRHPAPGRLIECSANRSRSSGRSSNATRSSTSSS